MDETFVFDTINLNSQQLAERDKKWEMIASLSSMTITTPSFSSDKAEQMREILERDISS